MSIIETLYQKAEQKYASAKRKTRAVALAGIVALLGSQSGCCANIDEKIVEAVEYTGKKLDELEEKINEITNKKDDKYIDGKQMHECVEEKVGTKYGDKEGEYDCVTLVHACAEKQGVEMNQGDGDDMFAHYTDPIAIIRYDKGEIEGVEYVNGEFVERKGNPLEDVETGDVAFVGTPYSNGNGHEYGIDVRHLLTVGDPVTPTNDYETDFELGHASGYYEEEKDCKWSRDGWIPKRTCTTSRGPGHGKVKLEESLIEYQLDNGDREDRDYMFFGRVLEQQPVE
jgi:hypothetical protein